MKLLIKSIPWTTVLCLTLLASGCATPTSPNSYCDVARPIRWNTTAELKATPALVTRQIVRHNEQWQTLCNK